MRIQISMKPTKSDQTMNEKESKQYEIESKERMMLFLICVRVIYGVFDIIVYMFPKVFQSLSSLSSPFVVISGLE